MKDLKSSLKAMPSINPGAKTASATGTAVATTGYEAVTFLVTIGAYTDGTHTLALEVSDDNSTYGAAAADDIIGTFPAISGAGQANATHLIGYKGISKYVRPKTTVAGATTGCVYGIAVLLGHPRYMPTA